MRIGTVVRHLERPHWVGVISNITRGGMLEVDWLYQGITIVHPQDVEEDPDAEEYK